MVVSGKEGARSDAPSVASGKVGQAAESCVKAQAKAVVQYLEAGTAASATDDATAGLTAKETALESRLVLSEADRATLKFKAGRGLIRVLVAQAAMGLAAALISWLIAGVGAGASALIGAGAYFVPNALFAMRLLFGLLASRPASPVAFFMGEIIKLGSAVVLLALAVHFWQGWLVWPALLFGLVCVLKGYVLLMLFHKLP